MATKIVKTPPTAGVITLVAHKQLGARIVAYQRDANSLDSRAHGLLLDCTAHAAMHGDVSMIERLLNSARNWNEMYAWVQRYTPVRKSNVKGADWPNLKLAEQKMTDKTWTPYAFEAAYEMDGGKHTDKIVSWGEAGANPFYNLPEVKAANNRVITEAAIFGFVPKLVERITKAVDGGHMGVEEADHAARRAKAIQEADAKFLASHPVPNATSAKAAA